MGYVIVLVLAVLAGGLVYWASMRFATDPDAPPRDGGREPEPDGGAASPPAATRDTAYIPVVRSTGSWQGRLGGAMGLVIAVAVAAAAAALVLYEAGRIISNLVSHASTNG